MFENEQLYVTLIPKAYTEQASSTYGISHFRQCDNRDLMTHKLKNPEHMNLVW